MQRRDFLQGMAFGGAAAWAPAKASDPQAYPAALHGLRGSAPGTMDAAHALAWSGSAGDDSAVPDPDTWDLVVVGAGISGLSAAHFYRQHINPKARILVLDNHDDFGGHARRNEFTVEGRTLLSYGGTQSFDSPQNYSAVARTLLRELGIDTVALRRAYDLAFFRQHALGMGVYYDPATFGRAALERSSPPSLRDPGYFSRHYVPGLMAPPPFSRQWERAPLTSAQQSALRRVLANTPVGAGKGSVRDRAERSTSYLDFLRRAYRVQDPALQALLSMPLAEDSALGGYAVSVDAAALGGLLGLGTAAQRRLWFGPEAADFAAEAAPENADDADLDGYFFHFPDGGATLARLLVQGLIPGVARFTNAHECLGARFDYAALDRPLQQAVNIRLNSTAVWAANVGQGVQLRYLRGGRLHAVRARHAVMAGWSAVSAHVVQGLPQRQKAAMRANIKMPMVYAQVVLRRWHALKKAGVAVAYAPGAPFQFCQMDFPVNMGPSTAPAGPDHPVCLLMARVPGPLLEPASAPDIFRAGRAELLGQDFAFFENAILDQLQGMYGPHGLDAQRDIAAITVNRWGHGYIWEDAQYQGHRASTLAAQSLGAITMAGSDSQGRAYLDAAIDAAWAAVQELRTNTAPA